MPTYEYACTSCGHRLEIVQSFSDKPLTTCPDCGGDLRKVFGSVGIVLKGSGFYRTDSRTGSGTKTATKEKTETAPASSDGSAARPGPSSTSDSSSSSASSASDSSSSSGSTSTSAAAAAS